MLPDERIIKATKGSKNLVIIGCGGCANESLAYDNNKAMKLMIDPNMGHKMPAPDAVTEEANRLKNIIKTENNGIDIVICMGICSMSSDETMNIDKWIDSCTKADTAVVLSCLSGVKGVKTRLGKNVKVIPGMKTVGTHFSYRIIDNRTDTAYIDHDKSSFLNLFERKKGNR